MSSYCKKCEKLKCTTNNCPCKRQNKFCDAKCGCSNCRNRADANSSDGESDEEETCLCRLLEKDSNKSDYEKTCLCKNRPVSKSCEEDSTDSDEKENCSYIKTPVSKTSKVKSDEEDAFSDINELAGKITEEITLKVSNRKEEVFEFRKNRDLYTDKKKNDVENPEVDHIVEGQIVGHAAAKVLGGISYTAYLKALKDALNLESFENYNVTFGEINKSKGNIIKFYLRDNINRGFPLRSIIKPETHFGMNMERIFQVMNVTHPIVEEFVAQGRRSDGHVTGGSTFEKISDEMGRIFQEMDLGLETRRTRRN